MIEFDNVSKTFENSVKAMVTLSVQIAKKEIFALVGPNGAGKTTFLRLLLGLLEPTGGRVSLPSTLSVQSGNVGCVLDSEGVYLDLTVRQNFRFFGSLYGLPEAEAKGIEYLRFFCLFSKVDKPVKTLSKGQRKIVSLCRAMITEPYLLVVDELTANLDPSNQKRLLDFIRELNELKKMIIVFSSHNLNHVAEIAQHILLINKGLGTADFTIDVVNQYTCHIITGENGDIEHMIAFLNNSSFAYYMKSRCVLSTITKDADYTNQLENELTNKINKCKVDSRPATLEDLYSCFVGVDNE